MKKAKFNPAVFYEMINEVRLSKSLSWRQFSKQTGVHPCTFSRIKHGSFPDVENFGTLLNYLLFYDYNWAMTPSRSNQRVAAKMKHIIKKTFNLTEKGDYIDSEGEIIAEKTFYKWDDKNLVAPLMKQHIPDLICFINSDHIPYMFEKRCNDNDQITENMIYWNTKNDSLSMLSEPIIKNKPNIFHHIYLENLDVKPILEKILHTSSLNRRPFKTKIFDQMESYTKWPSLTIQYANNMQTSILVKGFMHDSMYQIKLGIDKEMFTSFSILSKIIKE